LSHRVPLIGHALKIIRQLKDAAKADVPHVFPGPHGAAVTNPQKWLARIREATKLDFKYHDLRRTAASHMTGDCEVTRFVVAQILNHKESGVTQIYDRHSYDSEKRAALQKWDARLDKIVTGKTAKVVAIRG
jgi:integrase